MKKSIFILAFICFSCSTQKENYTSQDIVDFAIENAGVDKLKHANISFDFRDKHYKAERKDGKFAYSRSFDSITDLLTNSGFSRSINDNNIQLSDSIAQVYSNSVNSVHYFSVLPFHLNDKAVRKERLTDAVIKGKQYFKIKVTFAKEGGGKDHEDIFIYWFEKDSFKMDYLAYSYLTDGGGMRFRAVKKEHVLNGVVLRDYINYKPKSEIDLTNIDQAFEANKLERVSEIDLENIAISLQ